MLGWTWLIIHLHRFKRLETRYLWSFVGIILGAVLLSGWWALLIGGLWLTSNMWLGKRHRMTSSVKWGIGILLSIIVGVGALYFQDLGFDLGPLDRV